MIKLKPRTRIILLSVISILIVITIVLGITYSFMQANIESSSVTEVSLSSCANITLTDTGESINLGNSYPMSKTRALETTPYTLTITSSCEDGSGYNLYLATLNTNTLSASSIHYIITEHGNQNIVVEGMLSDASDGISDFEDYDIGQLNNGINGTYGSVYRLYSSGIQYNTEVSYDLYLYIDEAVTNETMGQTFVAGVAVKASDYDFATINGVSVTEATTDSITVSVDASNGTNNITNYYYSINNGEYVSSTSNIYTFEGLDMGTTYDIKVYVVDTNGAQSNIYSTSGETSSITLADYITSLYTTDGENGLYHHDGQGSYTNADQEAGDNSYRYSGANPNNYVCFGATGEDCQNTDNQYRIIGVFNNQVKLIKATSYGDYAWDVDSVNTWDGTTKPDIYTTLNTTYYNTLGNEWQNLIAESIWQVGGMNWSGTNTAKQYYDVEVGTGQSGYEETMKIGLMYVSDYGYGASPEKWTTALYEENYGTDNWLYLDSYEWLLSRSSSLSRNAFLVYSIFGGSVNYGGVNITFAVRPSFSLTSTVTISSGTGTSTDPFVLNLG